MPELNVEQQFDWARFHLHLVNQIKWAMERAVEDMSERLTEALLEQTRLLRQQNELLTQQALRLEDVREAVEALHFIGDEDAQASS